MSLTDDQADYAKSVFEKLDEQGLRARTDLRSDKIGFKIREHTLMHIPYLVVCGAREAEQGKVAVRTRKGADLGTMSVDDLIKLIKSDIIQRKNMPDADVAIEKARAEAEKKDQFFLSFGDQKTHENAFSGITPFTFFQEYLL